MSFGTCVAPGSTSDPPGPCWSGRLRSVAGAPRGLQPGIPGVKTP
eukprot:CAMPEP_0168433328 /NCGR_PEP_ID=MMETSP0228-20121227/39344_1 /TAXON_ID=133427 /ORGANISM="Protoceratium reticulatum, Strain CCCM 535 (=CCMP 1889)" /LENGTH=44 /DNA_ID= /DNA_START= /DNA_END= /DNA_ORIENTATION=